MWRPPERIQFEPKHGRIPTRAEAEGSRLFSPVTTGPVTLEQRTWVPAMVPWRATEDGFVTDAVVEWYARFAKGRPGAIVVEATGIRDVPSGPLMRIGDDRFIPGLKRLADAVREASDGQTRLFIQLIDFLSIRRRPDAKKYFERFLAITDEHRAALPGLSDADIRATLAGMKRDEFAKILNERELESLEFGYRERVTDMDLPHIRDLPKVLPDLFADAAWRAQEAGFDGAELHYAHAYTMSSFLSRKNTREDGYGGPRENRVKLPLEVFKAVRERTNADFAVGCRFLADECIEGGSDVTDAVYFGVEFAKAGMDFISTSRGGKFDDAKQPGVGGAAYPYTGPSGYECMPQYISDERGPFGRNVDATSAIRKAIHAEGLETPIVCTGGVHNFEFAEKMLADDVCDIVGSARQTLADPDWFLKTKLGLGQSIRMCEFTNYCEGLDQKHKTVTCQLWDKDDLKNPNVSRTSDGKRRLTPPDWTPPQ
ncbi:NADH:flavin oxidoreductase [Pseudorhodoplanes sinuspersici]|uniref:NADH oxidase n=1 Tax=Pseudorhodoplanes sinuspersici TaxID=1235591 RepID=A0A1W6ZTZ5_9HYPH|nr:NADH:flavin oxidoreductase [Pseudorhodoplanes sinuspersici]ARQ00601.1 NADH oxidase [Pseudorhodoplanes sinuspersici]RKE72199.1 2,4-dienoyl-CoA reductase-like NADH-dependent reductase (Old Yellow Enzyme family) [Pseudorhodoplanes sinuspersici]